MVEAAGVELSSVLTARELLIAGTATSAKKAALLDPLYVCTKTLFALESRVHDDILGSGLPRGMGFIESF
jgi:hypothetical protein